MNEGEKVDFLERNGIQIAAARLLVLQAIETRSASETLMEKNPTTWRQAMYQLLDEAARGVADPTFMDALEFSGVGRYNALFSTLSIYQWQMKLEAANYDWRQLAPE